MIIKLSLGILSTFLTFLIAYKVSKLFNLYDNPNYRKKHLKPIVFTGGISVLFSIILSLFILGELNYFYLNIIFFGFLLCILGFIDDIKNINYLIRIIIQFSIIFVFLYLADIKIDKILFFNSYIHLDKFSFIISSFLTLAIINSINYIDGIDGLCALIACNIFLYYLYLNGFDILLITLILILIIFLFFNFSFYKLPKFFLGDNGSYLIGFFIAYFSISVYLKNNFDQQFSQMFVAWILGFVVFEFISTSLSRLIRRKGLFTPGQDHIHLIFSKYLNNKFYALILILIINNLITLFGLFITNVNEKISFLFFIFCFILYFYLREFFLRKS